MRLTADLRDLAAVPAFRTLLGVRLISQTGDGMVQAGLATLFFFRPQNMTDAAGVAAALVVMLLPFCVVGPFTGPFIDRWRRRQILLVGNLVRAGLIAATALHLGVAGIGPLVYTAAGAVLGLLLRLLLPAGTAQDAGSLVVAVVLYVLAAGAVTRLGGDELGPERIDRRTR